MKKIKLTLLSSLLVSTSAVVSANDFSFNYQVEHIASTNLSVSSCLSTAEKASRAVGYKTRSNQNQKTLGTLVSGPEGDGKSLIVFCIAVDNKTVYVVQAFDYSGPSSPHALKVRDQVAEALAAAALSKK